MPQRSIEQILTRQLAEYLAMPIFLVDPDGDLLFYNEPAELILGLRFEETGPMSAEVWSAAFEPTDAEGALIPMEELPLVITLNEQRPASKRFWITGLDGVRRRIEVGAWPLIGHDRRNMGAVAMFWEIDS